MSAASDQTAQRIAELECAVDQLSAQYSGLLVMCEYDREYIQRETALTIVKFLRGRAKSYSQAIEREAAQHRTGTAKRHREIARALNKAADAVLAKFGACKIKAKRDAAA